MFASPTNFSARTLKSQPSATMQNTAILTLSEFKGMKERSLINTLNEEQRQRLEEKNNLKQMSNTRIQHWPDTITATRKQKEEARFQRFLQAEEERRRIDLEEVKYQNSVKERVIAQANKKVYESNDRVKAFQSALLLSDAMKERDAQIQINKRKQEIDEMIKEHYADIDKENMRLYDEKEEEKKILREEKKRANQAVLKNQHDEFKTKHIKRMQEEKIEGEIVKIKTIEALEKEKIENVKRRQKLLDAQEETRKANEYLEEIRQEERLKELEKEREIEAFAQKKAEVTEMRRMREELKFKEKQAARQRIIDAQTEKLRQIKNKEDEILNKNIKEAEIKAEEAERIKREKRDQLIGEIDKQIALTLNKRKVEHEKQKREDKDFQEFWREKNLELEAVEVQDKNAFKDRCKTLQQYHLKQAKQKQQKLEDQILKEFDDALKMKAAMENEEKVFHSYAEQCINEWDANGKNLKPLLLELEKYKKKTL